MVYHRALLQTFPAGSSLLRAAALAVALAGASAFSGLAEIFQRLYITGAYRIAITAPFYSFFIFKDLRISQSGKLLDCGTFHAGKLLKTIECPPYRWHRGQ
jgi:hypothetical protein